MDTSPLLRSMDWVNDHALAIALTGIALLSLGAGYLPGVLVALGLGLSSAYEPS